MFQALLIAASMSITVLDGDTFIYGTETIRIANIDAPETVQAKCDAERRLGRVAKARLTDLLSKGRIEVHIGDPATGRKRDRHGRLLATVTVDGGDVGEDMIADDLARPWTGRRQAWCN